MKFGSALVSIGFGVLGLARPAIAGDARFFSQPVLAFGSTRVDARAINDAGTIVGIVAFGSGQSLAGFVLQGSVETTIDTCGNSACFPTSISRNGTVAGFSGGQTGFVWKDGVIISHPLPLGQVFGSRPAFPNILLSDTGLVAFSDNTQSASAVYAGRPASPHVQNGLSSSYAVVNGMNASGVLSGFEIATVEGQSTPAIFFGKDGFFNLLGTPGEQQVSGGVINDSGHVGFATQSGVYIYANGATTTVLQAATGWTALGVQAINNKGRVVGTYVDAGQIQHIFYFNGTAVSTYGAYPASDTLHLALNDHGVMLVSDTPATASFAASYRISCAGSGC